MNITEDKSGFFEFPLIQHDISNPQNNTPCTVVSLFQLIQKQQTLENDNEDSKDTETLQSILSKTLKDTLLLLLWSSIIFV
jgi:hypothetical protein